MKKLVSLMSGLGLALLLSQPALACTGVYVGKDLTEDGSTIFGRTEDLETDHNKTFVVFPEKDNEEGAMLEDVNGFKYELPEKSFKYTALPDTTPEYGEYHEAGFNEFGVMMDATVSTYVKEEILAVDPLLEDGLAESAITNLILPHVKTAREGVEMLAKVIDEKGAAEGNSLIIADQTETWYIEIVSGHNYAAIKMPTDKFVVFPNAFFMGAIDVTDTENVIASENLVKTAEEAGTLVKDGEMIKVAASYGEKPTEGTYSRYWAGVNRLNPTEEVDLEMEEYPFYHTTDEKISIDDIFAFQRDRFEDTDVKAVDGKSSSTGNPEEEAAAAEGEEVKELYPIGNQNTMEAHIFQVREDMPAESPAIMWLTIGSPLASPYLPFFANITDTAESYKVTTNEYDENSYYWVTNKIREAVLADEDNVKMAVREKVNAEEEATLAEIDDIVAQLNEKFAADPEDAAKYVTDTTIEKANKAFEFIKALQDEFAKE
ncbi:C69 family dipeptidase [Eremococcus coleocola]|uniref:C69 family dipeptidase n=1 Tax=Eremococcus coleocola TaxID=88132 RepID=UPI00041996E7|nr:C69 family dipeptidase [Eremococcus coleocola]